MKRKSHFFRKLFSPIALTVIVSLIEIIILVGFFTFLLALIDVSTEVDNIWIYLIFRLFFYLINFAIFLILINRSENPEYKVSWVLFFALFPILSLILYLFFGNHGLREKDKAIITPTNDYFKKKFAKSEEERKEFNSLVDVDSRAVFNYLEKVTYLGSSKNNELTYYKNGEEFFPAFVESLKKAKEFIFMEFFIIGEGYWWSQIENVLIEKAKAGIEVRILYDALGSFGILPNDYAKRMRKLGIQCYEFHPFRPMLSGTYNNRDHRKIAIIDHQEAYTGGMNLADEYANTIVRFGYWKDTMVKIKGPGIANLIAVFLQNFDLAQKKLSDYGRYLVSDYQQYNNNGYIFFFGDGPGSYAHNEPIGEENYLQIIDSATKELWISTPYLIPTYRLLCAIKSAAKRGVDVHLFVPGIPDKKIPYLMAKSEFSELVKAGVHLYTYAPGFNHEKEMVADGKIAFCGTINFDFRSLSHHFECGVTIYNDPIIDVMIEDFKEMQKVSTIVPEDYHIGVVKKIFIALIKTIRPLL